MDGGVVDNQAIDSVEKACQQLGAHGSKMDLCIISDAVNPNIKQYEGSSSEGYEITYNFICLSLISACAVGIILTLLYPLSRMVSGAGFMLLLISAIALYYQGKIKKWLLSKLPADIEPIISKVNLSNTKLKYLLRFGRNRIKSLYLMTSEVVMQHVRRQHMSQVFSPKEHPWLLNAQYNLKDAGYWKQQMMDLELSPAMRPTKEMFDIADKANDMPTTLWFTPENFQDNLPQKILASGQFVTCWNLLCHIKEQKRKHPEIQTILHSLEDKMEKDWAEFKANPYCKAINFANNYK